MSNVDEYAVQSSGNRVEYILGVFSPKVRRLKKKQEMIKFFQGAFGGEFCKIFGSIRG